MQNMKRSIAVVVAVALMLGCAIGGTLAWLMDTSDPVVNTFTSSDVDITLSETNSNQDTDNSTNTNSYKMVPGATIAKDPKVTVEAGSEPCWLFVKIEKTNNYDTYMTHGIIDGWLAGNGTNIPSNVYYRKVDTADMGKPINIIYYDVNNNSKYDSSEENKVFVKTSVTKSDMEAAENSAPTLTFTAYAIQSENLPYTANATEAQKAATAWAQIGGNNN